MTDADARIEAARRALEEATAALAAAEAEAAAAEPAAAEPAAGVPAAAEAAVADAEAAEAVAPPAEPVAAATVTEVLGPLDAQQLEAVRAGYAFEAPALEIGAIVNGEAVPGVPVRIPLAMTNRHGLVAGATGTGKTKTLQVLAEQLSAAGVPVFAADIKGDLT